MEGGGVMTSLTSWIGKGIPRPSLVASEFTRDLKAFIGVAFVIIGVLDRQLKYNEILLRLYM